MSEFLEKHFNRRNFRKMLNLLPSKCCHASMKILTENISLQSWTVPTLKGGHVDGVSATSSTLR
jgi:hypothetical protein